MPDGRLLLITHSGKFHCDEVFAYVVLRLALGLGEAGADHVLVRTRDAAVIATGDVVWDVGSVHDPATGRFDHHQRGAPTRADGTPFSSAGLIWQVHGEAAMRTLLPPEQRALAGAIAAEIDGSVVRRIDENDNGVASAREDTLGLASLVGDCNPPWDAPQSDVATDAAFGVATALVDGVLRRRAMSLRARLAAAAEVVAAHRASADPRILELDRGMPWKAAVFAHALPVVYAIYPVSNGNWMVDCMPPEAGSFAQRLPLPEAWAGLQDAALAEASGVADAVFVHVRRFVGGARTREGALEMARRAVGTGPEAPGAGVAGSRAGLCPDPPA
jgi:uncharacterized UPF0160 family protein